MHLQSQQEVKYLLCFVVVVGFLVGGGGTNCFSWTVTCKGQSLRAGKKTGEYDPSELLTTCRMKLAHMPLTVK